MRIISAIWSSWLHSQLWEPLWQGLFSSVRYYGHSGSQEIGHLKLVVFAGEWLFEEFLRANGAYRGFFLCGLLKKPYTINTVENSDGGTQGENVRWGAHRGKIHCRGAYGFLRSTQQRWIFLVIRQPRLPDYFFLSCRNIKFRGFRAEIFRSGGFVQKYWSVTAANWQIGIGPSVHLPCC